jgi:hypothetical protein
MQQAKVLCALACLACVPFAAATEYHGQVNFGGVPVPGATVTLTQGDKVVSVVTDSQGLYEFPDVADGAWKIEIRMRGFSPLIGDVTVAANTPQVGWELKLLSLSELLADAQTQQPAPKPVATGARAVSPAAKAAAAASAKPAQPDAPTPATSAEESTERPSDGLLINGSVNNAATSAFSLAPAFGNRRAGSKSLYTGGLVLVLDNAAFNARPYSLTGQQEPKGTYSRVTTGFTLGGPLNIPHLLYHGPNFFVAYQWTRNQNITIGQGLVPSTNDPTADLAVPGAPFYAPAAGLLSGCKVGPGMLVANNVIPLGCISPVALKLLSLYPTPSPNLAGNSRYNYETNERSNTHQDQLQSRLDKTFGRRDQVYGGFGFQSIRADSANLFGFVDTTDSLGLQSNVNWSHRFNHQIFAVATYQFTRQRTQVLPQFENRMNVSGADGIVANRTPGIATANGGNDQEPANWGPPTLAFNSISSLNDGNSAFNRNRTDAFASHGQMTRGHHNLTVGGDFRRQQFNELMQQNPRGTYTFTGAATASAASAGSGSDFADFLFGVPDTSALAFGNADKYFRQSVYDLYATDDWRVRPELTINAGLRWEYGAPLTELKGRLVNLNTGAGFATATQVLGNNPTSGYPTSLVQPDKHGFEPRVALSWRPLPASTLVIKAGYGIYDDTSIYITTAQMMSQQASTFSTSTSVSNGPGCGLTLAAGFINCATTTPDTFAVDPNLRVGYAKLWQLSAQRDLPAALVLTVTYQGTKGTRGMQEFLPNTCPPPQTTPCTAKPFGYVYRASNGNSTREAGIVQLRRRLRNGLTASLQYTYAKSIDDDADLGGGGHIAATAAASASSSSASSGSAGSPSIAQNWLNLNAERGLSSFDQRHTLAASLQYTSGMGMGGGTLLTGWRGKVLKEWTMSTQIASASGLPETPVYQAAVPFTGFTGTIRPDPTGAPVRQNKGGVFLNSAAFVAPVSGQWGTARRNSLPGPDQFSLNGSLARTFRLHDPFNLDVRMDATNLLNHAVYSAWNNVWNSSIFGAPVAVNPMRSMQLTGRLRF